MQSSPSRFRIYLILLGLVFLAGIIGFMVFEGMGIPDAVYFLVVTIATVGYGDITPKTEAGKALTVLLIIAGVGTFVAVFANSVEVLLSREETRMRKRKINMIIGVFFSEFGTEMLRRLSKCNPSIDTVRGRLKVSAGWNAEEFIQIKQALSDHRWSIDGNSVDLEELRDFLTLNRPFLLTLLENPVIFEHDSFSDLLQAFFHLTEELLHRADLSHTPPADRAHLTSDLERGYRLLIIEWLSYMEHLRDAFPYLFSLAVRTNPFDEQASVVIESSAEVSDR